MGDNITEKTDDQKKIEEQAAKIADLEALNQKLTIEEANSQATIAGHEATIADLRSKNERLLKLAGQVKEPEKEPAEKPKRSKPEVTIDGKNYKFRFGAFSFNGTRYEAKDAALDENLLKKIIDIKGQAILKQIF